MKGHWAQLLMDETTVAQLVASTNASAEAIAEVAKALKLKFGEEKRDRFSEASKVVRQPDVFSPATPGEELSQWQDWKLSFQSWLTYAQTEFEKDFKEAESSEGPMDFVEMTPQQHE